MSKMTPKQREEADELVTDIRDQCDAIADALEEWEEAEPEDREELTGTVAEALDDIAKLGVKAEALARKCE